MLTQFLTDLITYALLGGVFVVALLEILQALLRLGATVEASPMKEEGMEKK